MQQRQSIVIYLCFIPILFLLVFCKSDSEIGSYLGPVSVPNDNPQSFEKIAFGKQLFFDKRLSLDNSVSCATCHVPELAFTNGQKLSAGIHNRLAMRNAPTLLNVAYQKTLMFDGEVPNLEMQVLVPLKDSAEMGNQMKELIKKLRDIPEYQKQAQEIFKRDFDAYVLTRALASFQRSIISINSPFDSYYMGNENAISTSAERGWMLFSEKLYCTKCHAPPHFTNFTTENNGLYATYEDKFDKGRFRINGDSSEIGSFKVPVLRNISQTAPYMHDGSMANLSEVLDHYSKGGNGHLNQSKNLVPFTLSNQEKKDLLAFFKSLSGTFID